MKIIWSATAIDDLTRLRSYIAQSNPTAAADMAARILGAVEHLVRFPAIGRAGRAPNTRELIVPGTPFIIVYTIAGATLDIAAVLHAARRWPEDKKE
jgi:addiction module RelE/StbE family toxin